ncbi:ThuA domain-containing protein [Novosphingobium sp. YJ-S2-02]|uniref:ThuA domain-containing protein n=1 Tax=Novosphingobium aureum TaxID=2792964 RepID=A0A931HD96_9SPHN|nr:alpha-amylase family protein [Novosphingobium aureum]MBH0113851.1 ThuA domain-containing protein [Novosphingobium aureum]
MIDIDRRTVLAGAAVSALALPSLSRAATDPMATLPGWQADPMRWFQLAFTEDDPGAFDPDFWMAYFREIGAQGVCLSAGGGIAFYPTRIPHHGKSANMTSGRDPFGTMALACKREGIDVLARIDPHAMPQSAFAAHPEWAARDAQGEARRHWSASDLYLTCPYGPYNFEFMPEVIDEIATRYPVDGFFGNRWNTLGLCHCDSCKRNFEAATGAQLPTQTDPATPEGLRWHEWSQSRLLAVQDLWNETIVKRRPNAFFVSGTERRGIMDYDAREIGERMKMVFGDRQARSSESTYYTPGTKAWNSGRFAKELRGYMFDKPVGHIISVGVEEEYRWKDSVQDAAEIRIWAAGSIAQGARPWITKFNAKPFDRRWMPVVKDLFNWHRRHERYLRNTANLARVALVIENRGPAVIGGAQHRLEMEGHRRGFYQAMLEARIPFDAIDAAYLDPEHLARFDVLVLANAAVLSESQCAQLRAFVARGGAIVATHETSLYDEMGKKRPDFALADLFGCHYERTEAPLHNSYLTLRAPHPALAPLEGVSRTIAATARVHVRRDGPADVPITLVPSFPDLPMERVFTDVTESDIPMALCRKVGKGRVAYLPMNIAATFEELQHADHMRIMAGMVHWALGARQPMEVAGPGLVDIAWWRQERSLAAHIVNLNNPMTGSGSYREAIPTGPYEVSLELPEGAQVRAVTLLDAGMPATTRRDGERLVVTVPSVSFHEIIAVDLA